VAAEPQGLATPPTPEAWYAAIEKLRAQGRLEEAERELERLEKAYPGWLEKHLEERAPR
jgi:outer membrane protein assembly factor BamD (BamD/ComL family)